MPLPNPPDNFKTAFNYKKLFLYLILVLLVIDVFSLSYFRIMDRFGLVTVDFRYSVRSIFPQKKNPDIVLIEVGEDTLSALGKWPLPRDYHASLIDVLSKFKARMIIFDILFCEPTGWDNILVQSAKDAGNVYFPFAFRLKEKHKKGIPEAVDIDAPLLRNLQDVSKGTGFINKVVDIDGKVRQVPIFIKFKGKLYPSLAYKAACDYLNVRKIDGIPVGEKGCVLLNFSGRWGEAFKHYSYLDILAAHQDSSEGKTPRIDLNELKGKVCFIGLTATGTQELGPIPIENNYPMLGVHANLFNMLTQHSYLRRLDRISNLAILIILAFCLLFLIVRFRPFMAFLASLGIILLLFISSILLFAFYGVWIDMVCPGLILFGIYLVVTITKYINEMKARERIQKELAVAASIQKCFLPAEIPSIQGLDIAVEMNTAKEVGGDLYDFVKLDDARLGIMIADVSGKGVPASLFMAKIETLFKVYSKNEGSPSGVISKLNNEVACDSRSGLFTTLIYAIFDVRKMKLVFSDAGHLPMLLFHAGKVEKLVSDDGMAVGIIEETSFADKGVSLSKGDIAVFYTDGVSESRDIKGNEFGLEKLISLVEQNTALSTAEILRIITDELRHFQGKAVQHDDMTIIVVKVY